MVVLYIALFSAKLIPEKDLAINKKERTGTTDI